MKEKKRKLSSEKDEKNDPPNKKSFLKENKNEMEEEKDSKTILMFHYMYGIKKPQNIYKSKKICLKECKRGNIIAKGTNYYFGFDVEKDFKKSFEFFSQSIESDQFTEKEKGYSTTSIAYFYIMGEGVKRNYPMAFVLLKKACQIGNSCAMSNLGHLYMYGKGVEKNIKKSIKYYEKAAFFGNTFALFNLAYFYLNQEPENNLSKALKLLEDASELGSTDSMVFLAEIYFNGTRIDKNLEKSFFLFQKACNLGDVNAMKKYGEILKEQGNYDKSAYHFYNYFMLKNQKKFQYLILDLVRENCVTWKPEYHRFWCHDKLVLNSQIVVLLLVSKHRKNSSIVNSKNLLIKGVIIIVIRFLCHFSQPKFEK